MNRVRVFALLFMAALLTSCKGDSTDLPYDRTATSGGSQATTMAGPDRWSAMAQKADVLDNVCGLLEQEVLDQIKAVGVTGPKQGGCYVWLEASNFDRLIVHAEQSDCVITEAYDAVSDPVVFAGVPGLRPIDKPGADITPLWRVCSDDVLVQVQGVGDTGDLESTAAFIARYARQNEAAETVLNSIVTKVMSGQTARTRNLVKTCSRTETDKECRSRHFGQPAKYTASTATTAATVAPVATTANTARAPVPSVRGFEIVVGYDDNDHPSSEVYEEAPITFDWMQHPYIPWGFYDLAWSGWGSGVATATGRYERCEQDEYNCPSGNVKLRLFRPEGITCGHQTEPSDYWYTRLGITREGYAEHVEGLSVSC